MLRTCHACTRNRRDVERVSPAAREAARAHLLLTYLLLYLLLAHLPIRQLDAHPIGEGRSHVRRAVVVVVVGADAILPPRLARRARDL